MRILILNPFGIGDVLFSTPLLSNLRQAFPDGFIGYICNKRAQDVLQGNFQLNEIFVFEKDEYRALWKQAKIRCVKKFLAFLFQIKSKHFDAVIDLSLGYQYSFFLMLIGIKKRIGYNYRKRGRFLTDKVTIGGYEDKPITDYYLDLLKFLEISPKQFNLSLTVADSDKKWADSFFSSHNLNPQDLVAGIIPAGGASWGRDFSYRHWPWEHYVELADKLVKELQAKVIILGDVSEQAICAKVQQSMQTEAVSACGKTTLKQFAALLAKCTLVVCNDGGPLHIAISQDALTVSIFGPVDEKVYGPYPPASKHIVVTKGIACRPCYKKFKVPPCQHQRQCVKGITADEVFAIIKNTLGRKNADSASI